MAAWAARLDDNTIAEFLGHLIWLGEEDKPVDELILLHLELSRLSEKNLHRLGGCLRMDSDTTARPLPSIFLNRYITELGRVSSLSEYENRAFLGHLAKTNPLGFYAMLKQRVLETQSRREAGESFSPLPLLENLPLVSLPPTPNYPELVEDLFARWRAASPNDRFWWRHLFQDAALRVSPLGLACLNRWLDETTSADDIGEIIDALKFQGSMLIFTESDFVLKILAKIRAHAPTRQDELEFSLRNSAAPTMRGFTDGELDPEYRYYREEAAKAAEVFARNPDLSAFYREIVRVEATEAEARRRWVKESDNEWN